MLPLAENDLGSPLDPPIFLFLVLHEIRTSHGSVLPIPLLPFTKRHVRFNCLVRKAHDPTLLSAEAEMDYGMRME
jgi:hypothetical protein